MGPLEYTIWLVSGSMHPILHRNIPWVSMTPPEAFMMLMADGSRSASLIPSLPASLREMVFIVAPESAVTVVVILLGLVPLAVFVMGLMSVQEW